MAVVMSFAVFAFTACDPAEDSSVVDSVLAALQTGKYAALSSETTGTVKQSGVGAGTVKTSGKFNIATGNADIVSESVGAGVNAGVDDYSYVYLRDWNAYTYSSDTKPADFSGIEWSAEGNLNDFISQALQGSGIPVDFASVGGVSSVFGLIMPLMCHLELSFAKAAGGITEDASAQTLTVDVNKTLYNFVNDIKGVVNGVTDSTTVGDLLGNATVKKYFGVITELVPVDTVKSMLSQSGINVSPDEGSSTYDYIVKVISSEEVKNLIGSTADITLPDTLDKFTLAFILNGAGMDIAKFKTDFEELTSGITETQFSVDNTLITFPGVVVTFSNAVVVTFSNAKEVYSYDDSYAITSISSQITIGANMAEGVFEVTLSGKTDLLASEVTLEEIDFSNVALPSDSAEFNGVYKFSSLTILTDEDVIVNNVGDEGYTEDFCVMESYDGETFTLTIVGYTLRGTWTQYGETVILYFEDGDVFFAYIDGDTVGFSLEYDDETTCVYVLVKA